MLSVGCSPPPRWVLGVDPGCPGGGALFGPGGVETVFLGPTRPQARTGAGKDRPEVDGPALHKIARTLAHARLTEGARLLAVVEDVASRPTDSPVSAFKFGMSVRAWLQALEVEGWTIACVAPQVWQSHVPGIKGHGDERKASYHAAALLRWPEWRNVLVGTRGGAKTDPAAALWIGEWGWRFCP